MGGAEAQTQVSLTPGCCFPIREQPSTSSEGFLTNSPAALCSNLQTWLGRASTRFSCGGLSWTDSPREIVSFLLLSPSLLHGPKAELWPRLARYGMPHTKCDEQDISSQPGQGGQMEAAERTGEGGLYCLTRGSGTNPDPHAVQQTLQPTTREQMLPVG